MAESTFRLGFVTSRDEPDLTPDDRVAIPILRTFGIDVVPVVWTDDLPTPGAFSGLVVRSTWDYHLKYPAFLAWLDSIEKSGIPVWNEPDMMRWNSNKLYLLELRDRGVRIPSTFVATSISDVVPAGFFEAPIVLKPTVSADSFRTVHVDSSDKTDLQGALTHILPHSAALVQEFMPEVRNEGEYSFVFIEGAFSHAVLKRPAEGDFRVQEELGGSLTSITPSPGLLAHAQRVISLLEPTPLYARIDGVRRGTELVVMELELIEPSLYFLHSEAAAEQFARACQHRLSSDA